MARSKKTTKSKTGARAKKAAKKAPKKAAKRASARRAKGRGAGTPAAEESDVERRWREYWECRTALESSVAAVVAAQTALAEAKEDERARRAVFDRTKEALRDLLEVEPASSATRAAEGPRHFDRAGRLGVVEPEPTEEEAEAGAEEG
ncbi:MAG: hypothetical protein AAF721_08345 [Myxococcota bacterium]